MTPFRNVSLSLAGAEPASIHAFPLSLILVKQNGSLIVNNSKRSGVAIFPGRVTPILSRVVKGRVFEQFSLG